MTKQEHIDEVEYNENMFVDDPEYLFTSRITAIEQVVQDKDLSEDDTLSLLNLIVGYMNGDKNI